jgi:hypothetical protein
MPFDNILIAMRLNYPRANEPKAIEIPFQLYPIANQLLV